MVIFSVHFVPLPAILPFCLPKTIRMLFIFNIILSNKFSYKCTCELNFLNKMWILLDDEYRALGLRLRFNIN